MESVAKFFQNPFQFFRQSIYHNATLREELKVFLNQIYYTALQSCSMVFLLASIIGALLMVIGGSEISKFGTTDYLANISIVVLFRELSPLIPFVVVAARSGSAMATELSLMKHNQEIVTLEAFNINPYRMIFRPRVFGFLASLYILSLAFFLSSLFVGAIISHFVNPIDFGYFLRMLISLVNPEEFFVYHLKIIFGGIAIPLVCFYYIKWFKGQTTLIPVVVMKTIVTTLVVGIVGFTVLDLYLYAVLGASLG